MADYDAMVPPTLPTAPPRLDAFAADSDYGRLNLLALRNPTVVNMIDGCAISLPVHERDGAPVGLMLAAFRSEDARLFQIARLVERVVSGATLA